MLNLPGWLIQPPPRSNQATKTGSAQLRSREKGLNTQPRPFNLCETFWQRILKLWYSISERIIYISLLELLQLAGVHGWWSSQLQWWRFFTMFLLSNSTPKSSMQNKQNKTRENKKKYTLLLELLQSGFEDYATTSIHSCDNLSGHQWQQPWIHLQSFWQFSSFWSRCHGLSSPPLEVEKFNGKHKDGGEENSPANQHSCDCWEEAVFESKARVDVICDCWTFTRSSYNSHMCGYITKLWHNQTIDCPSHWTYPVIPNPPCWN